MMERSTRMGEQGQAANGAMATRPTDSGTPGSQLPPIQSQRTIWLATSAALLPVEAGTVRTMRARDGPEGLPVVGRTVTCGYVSIVSVTTT